MLRCLLPVLLFIALAPAGALGQAAAPVASGAAGSCAVGESPDPQGCADASPPDAPASNRRVDITALPDLSSPGGLHPVSIGVLTRDQLEELGAITLPELLDGPLAGTYSLDVGMRNDLERRIRIRGPVGFAACPRCGPKVFLDGFEVDPAAYSALSAEHLERVEVIRGPQASLVYGSDTGSGVVLLTSRKGPLATGTHVEASAMVGSVATPYEPDPGLDRNLRVSLDAGLPAGIRFNLGVSRSSRAGFVPQYDSDATTLAFGLSAESGDFQVGGTARYTDRAFTYPGWAAAYYHLYADGILPPWGQRIDDNDFATYNNLAFGLRLSYSPLPWWRNTLVLGDAVVERELRYLPTFQVTDSLITAQTDRFALPSIRFTSGAERPLGSSSIAVQAGLDYRDGSRLRHESIFYATGNSRAINWRGQRIDEATSAGGGFTEAQLRLASGLIFSAGLRADSHSYFGEEFGDWAWTRRAGVALHTDPFPGWTLQPRLTWAQAIATPMSEMITGIGAVQPNPDLAPQTTSGWEFGLAVSGADGRFTLDGTLFHQLTRDALGRIEVYQGDTRLLYTNFVGSLLNSGGEVALTWLTDYTSLRANLLLVDNEVRNRINDDEPPVTEDPAPETTAWVEGEVNLRSWLGRDAYVGGRFTHLGERYAFDPRAVYTAHQRGETPDNNHSWFGGVSRGDVFVGGDLLDRLEARIEMRNVTDNLTPESPEIVLPGRQLRLSLQGRI